MIHLRKLSLWNYLDMQCMRQQNCLQKEEEEEREEKEEKIKKSGKW